MTMIGRRKIFTTEKQITPGNVVDVLQKSLNIHVQNRRDIEYLYDYYRGEQPILKRTKEVHSEILNKIVVNHANEIVAFKTGYMIGEPVQYVCRTGESSGDLESFNAIIDNAGKNASDRSIVEWFHICGTAYRIVLPGEPLDVYTLDPRRTFVVYADDLQNTPLMGVWCWGDNQTFDVYTSDMHYTIENNRIKDSAPHMLGDVPIIEYPGNMARLGSFEIVLEQLDALNTIESNRVDGIEQFIQSIMVFYGVNITPQGIVDLREQGGIAIPNGTDVKYLVQELNQTQTQTLVNNIYDSILTICGMPNRNGGSSTSDTGAAVILRDGWSDAEARAKDAESMFIESEKRFLKIAVRICNELNNMDLTVDDIQTRFTRRNYENIQGKAQVLVSMLNNPKIHPRLAFIHCNMFPDPEAAYQMSAEYEEEQARKAEAELNEDVRANGQDDSEIEQEVREDV